SDDDRGEGDREVVEDLRLDTGGDNRFALPPLVDLLLVGSPAEFFSFEGCGDTPLIEPVLTARACLEFEGAFSSSLVSLECALKSPLLALCRDEVRGGCGFIPNGVLDLEDPLLLGAGDGFRRSSGISTAVLESSVDSEEETIEGSEI